MNRILYQCQILTIHVQDENDNEDTTPSAPPAEELEPESVSNKTSDEGESSNSIKLEQNAIELLINGKTINLYIPSKYQSNYNIDEVVKNLSFQQKKLEIPYSSRLLLQL